MSNSSSSGSSNQIESSTSSTVIINNFEQDGITEEEFNGLVSEQEVQLDMLFQNAQQVAKDHMSTLYNLQKTKYKTILKKYIEEYEKKIKEESAKTEIVNQQLKDLEVLYEQNNQKSGAFKEKLATFMGSVRKRHESNNTLIKCFAFWNQLTLQQKSARKIDGLADRISSNFTKNKVFSRFAYNLVARNYEAEKKEYLQKFNHQHDELLSKYTTELSLIKRQLSMAEMSAVKERGLRLRLEEDIRRMLLKNMTSMNVEAIVALKQPLVYETDIEATDQELYYLNQQLAQRDIDAAGSVRAEYSFGRSATSGYESQSHSLSLQPEDQAEGLPDDYGVDYSTAGVRRSYDNHTTGFNSTGSSGNSEIYPRQSAPAPMPVPVSATAATGFTSHQQQFSTSVSSFPTTIIMNNNKMKPTMKSGSLSVSAAGAGVQQQIHMHMHLQQPRRVRPLKSQSQK